MPPLSHCPIKLLSWQHDYTESTATNSQPVEGSVEMSQRRSPATLPSIADTYGTVLLQQFLLFVAIATYCPVRICRAILSYLESFKRHNVIIGRITFGSPVTAVILYQPYSQKLFYGWLIRPRSPLSTSSGKTLQNILFSKRFQQEFSCCKIV